MCCLSHYVCQGNIQTEYWHPIGWKIKALAADVRKISKMLNRLSVAFSSFTVVLFLNVWNMQCFVWTDFFFWTHSVFLFSADTLTEFNLAGCLFEKRFWKRFLQMSASWLNDCCGYVELRLFLRLFWNALRPLSLSLFLYSSCLCVFIFDLITFPVKHCKFNLDRFILTPILLS